MPLTPLFCVLGEQADPSLAPRPGCLLLGPPQPRGASGPSPSGQAGRAGQAAHAHLGCGLPGPGSGEGSWLEEGGPGGRAGWEAPASPGNPCSALGGEPWGSASSCRESQVGWGGEAPPWPPVRRLGVSVQLKEKHKQSGGGVGALEELENAFSLAEESCPGISDKLMAHLVERVQR